MKRDFSGWGVLVVGGLLALLGAYWLSAGWEHIQIERGWSQFIAGAMALSGGVVTMAIGRLIRLLAQQSTVVASAQTNVREPAKATSARSATRPPEAEKRIRPPEPASPAVASVNAETTTTTIDPPKAWTPPAHQAIEQPSRNWSLAPPQVAEDDVFPAPPRMRNAEINVEPVEVDRYAAGESTYVMYSDGSVEVRTPEGAQRYASLEALRANSSERRR